MSILLNWRAWAALILAGVLAFTHITAYRSGAHSVQTAWDAAKVAQERQANEQAERNRELQRQAERKYVVQSATQDRFIVQTVKEIEHAAAPLASCDVSPDLVRMLNDARSCALSDRPSACGPDGAVPGP